MAGKFASRVTHAARRARHVRAPLKIVLPTVAALGAGAAVAVGAIPSSDGTITGCYQNVPANSDVGPSTPYGTLRVIDPSQNPANGGTGTDASVYSCTTNEATITWNQQGPRGPQGQAGQPGAPGAPGAQGAQGPPGTVSGQSGGNSQIYLKLASVKGESTAQGHENQIALGAFVLHMASSGAPTGGSLGKGAGKLSAATFTIVKALDTASPALFLDLASGKVVSSAEIFVYRRAGAGGKPVELADYALTDVVFKNIDESSTADKPTETISGIFRSIKFSSFSQNPNGGTTTTSDGWNLAQNKALLRH